MRRITVELDEALLTRAQAVLSTKGIKDTVDQALREVLRRDAWIGLREWAIDNDDLRSPEIAAEAWRSRGCSRSAAVAG
jgi:Arc/MetJ family transcription regulator